MAGQHHRNPVAQAAARGEIPRFPPGAELYGFNFEPVIELNKAKMAEVVAIVDAARLEGRDPRIAVPNINPTENPEHFDYVVYNRPTIGRPSALAIRADQIPTAQIRWSEHLRIPLVELKARVDSAFAGHEAQGKSQQ